MELPSRLIDRAVDQIAGLPGVGRRTALRLALHLLARNEEDVRRFTESIQDMREGVKACTVCGNLGEGSEFNQTSCSGEIIDSIRKSTDPVTQ